MEPQELNQSFLQSLSQVFVGPSRVGELLLIALLAQCHVLVEDVPGVGKTTLVKAVAKLTGMEFKRIQFSPDLLPGDVLGAGIWNPGTRTFDYHPGPIQTQCLLADELNRGSTRTQAAFLEAMQEGQVTVDGHTYSLPKPFWVVATQNPLDYSSTFLLPEAELDRFGISLGLGYPSIDDEQIILNHHRTRSLTQNPTQELTPLFTSQTIVELQNQTNQVQVSPALTTYLAQLADQTRRTKVLNHGMSPRATIHLMKLAQARALVSGRNVVLPEDIQACWIPCLSHRLSLSGETRLGEQPLESVLLQLFHKTPVPGPA
jgi:MoxR-like ATPase